MPKVDPEKVVPEGAPAPKSEDGPAPVPVRRAPSAAIVQGRRPALSETQKEPLAMKANEYPRFLMVYRPERYDYFQQIDQILPIFGKLREVPGINRVDSKGSLDPALLEVQKSGGRVIYERDVSGGYLVE